MGKNKDKLKAMIRELGDAISDNLIQSNAVQDVLQRIKEHGYHVDLSLAVGVCLYRDQKEDESPSASCLPEDADHELRFEINQHDLEFLNSIRIKLDSRQD
ncbi:MAG: hypothetical protein AB1611_19585 [bacterium]